MDQVADLLCTHGASDPSHYAVWVEALWPIRARLRQPLTLIFRDSGRREVLRAVAFGALLDYFEDEPDFLTDRLLHDADAQQFGELMARLQRDPARQSRGCRASRTREARRQTRTRPAVNKQPAGKPPRPSRCCGLTNRTKRGRC